ncbi:MAG: hypothetical protein MJZ06_09880 [Bacteroidaceae bacterium]|nr:hypothetical protein [Bacteroidaceae bacterium]
MNTVVYPRQMRFSRYDGTHFLVYLHESVSSCQPDADSEPVPGYSYSGNMPDGGTLIECDEDNPNKIINGIIRSRYLQTEEDAIKTHQIQILQAVDMTKEKIAEYRREWMEFQEWRQYAIDLVHTWFSSES